ncbi:protein of unknown function [Treponema bryantii]|uniref:DUF4932 domain-containing protein n=1 Tax=Treponema bryantii TaxID=163 RepID=A0A1H9ARJ8_9SPIR|nr:DUF4932 domain-containing protein [Treponema bryantii]SEP79165.1 protein of unknown function [Treponema bryantii]
MKKTILSFLLLSSLAVSSLAAKTSDSEYKIEINDKITIGTSRAYECVATIAHLADFPEFNVKDYSDDFVNYDEYFNKYLNNQDVAKAILYFQKLKQQNGFAYDSVASVGTYLSDDCHSFRTSLKNVKKYLEPRAGDPKKIKEVVSAFYDATDFDTFYQSQMPAYEKALLPLYSKKDELIKGVECFESYYKTNVSKITITVSVLNGNNGYGTSFNDGKNLYFEPKLCPGYTENFIFHELSHPLSNPLVDKIVKNKVIMDYVEADFQGAKKHKMASMAYPTTKFYLYELFNRANTMNILKGFCDTSYITKEMLRDKQDRFDEIFEVVELLDKYRLGDYKNIDAFLPELEKGFIEILKAKQANPVEDNFYNVLSPDETSSFEVFGKTYKAEYCGSQDLTGFQDFVLRKYWRLEDAYNDVKEVQTIDILPYNNYPFPVEAGEVFRIEYLRENGKSFFEYERADENDYIDGEPVTRGFYLE